LANKFGDYRCKDTSNVINICILITYLGIVASYLVLSLLGGYFGRKTFVVLGLMISCAGVIMSLFVGNIYVASVGIMFGLFGVQWVFSISFTIIS